MKWYIYISDARMHLKLSNSEQMAQLYKDKTIEEYRPCKLIEAIKYILIYNGGNKK